MVTEPVPRTNSGAGRALVAVYGVFALAATARAGVQLATRYSEAPLAYLLSAMAGVIYILATITLATQEGWLGTWIGSTVGMVAADALAIVVGAVLGKHLPERSIKYGAATLFAIFGLVLIAEGLGWF